MILPQILRGRSLDKSENDDTDKYPNRKNKLSLAIGDIRLKLRKKRDSNTILHSHNHSVDVKATSDMLDYDDF